MSIDEKRKIHVRSTRWHKRVGTNGKHWYEKVSYLPIGVRRKKLIEELIKLPNNELENECGRYGFSVIEIWQIKREILLEEEKNSSSAITPEPHRNAYLEYFDDCYESYQEIPLGAKGYIQKQRRVVEVAPRILGYIDEVVKQPMSYENRYNNPTRDGGI
jgi:hypothetical protein